MNEDIAIYQRMVEEIEDYAILFLDKEGNIKNWNKGAQKIKGYHSEEIIGKHFRVFYTPADQARGLPEQMIKNARLMGKANSEGWRVRKDGTTFWGSIVITAVYGERNILKGFSKITRDLTERKLAEEKLLQANAELERKVVAGERDLNLTQNSYKHLFTNNPMPMWVMDIVSFRFLDVNDVAIASYGYSREEFLRMTALDIRPEEERLAFREILHPDEVNIENYNRGVWQHKKRDGAIVFVEIFAYNIVFNGSKARLVLSIDITARRLAEKKLVSSVQHFRALLENTYDSISLVDGEGYILYQTPSAERMLGYATEDIAGKSEFDHFHPEDREEAKKRFDTAVANPGRPIWGINRMQHKDGYYIWVEGTTTSLLDNDHVNAVVNNFRDITERKLAGESLSKSKRQIEKVYREQILLSERLSSILNALPANIALLDNKGEIVAVNDAWRRFADDNGFIGESYGIGDNYIEVAEQAVGAGSQDGVRIAGAIRGILAGHIAEFNMEYHCESAAKRRWLKVIITRENDSEGSGIVLMHLDITERKEAENEVRLQKTRLENLLRGMGDAFVTLDDKWQYTFANENALALMAKKKQEIIGRNMWKVFPDIVGTIFETEYHKVLTTRKETSFEVYYPSYDMWIDVRAYPHEGGVAVFYNDITERKKAEATLRESEETKRLIMNSSMDAIMCMNADGEIIVWNPKAEKMFGWTEEEIIGKRIKDTVIPENDRSRHEDGLTNYFSAEKGIALNKLCEDVAVRKNGEIFPIEITVCPINQSGTEFFCAFLRDITERKLAEERITSSEHKFRALVENSIDAIALLDEQGRIIYQSVSSEKVTGYSVSELLEKESVIVHPEDKSRMQMLFANTIQNPGVPQFSRHRIDHKEKGWIEVEGTLTNMLHDKDVQAIVTNFRDVTERIQAEQKIINVNRLYSFISQINQAIVHSSSEKEVLREACRIAVQFGHFKMAWVGMLDIQKGTLNLVEENNIHPDDLKLFENVAYDKNGPTAQVLQTGKYYICNDIANAPDLDYWKPFVAARNIGSTMMLPIKKRGEIIGTFNLYAQERDLFNEDEIKLLQEVAGDISFAIDVFEKEHRRKEAEEKLRQNEFRLNEAQEIAHVGNWEIDLITNTHLWSQEAQRIIGFVSEGKHPVFETYMACIHPEDKPSILKMMSEARGTYSNSYFYHRIIKPTGEVRYVYSESKFEFNEFNEPVRLHGIIHDITNAKLAEDSLAQSEENLRLIMDLIPQCIYAKNVNGKLIFVNKSFAKLYGCSPNELISRSITEAASFNQINDFLPEQDRDIILGGNTEEIPELIFTDQDGMNRVFYTLKVPYTLAGSNEKAVLGIALDITERKQAEMERTKIIADIVQRNKDLEQFSYIISHNLRAPVANISGIADILKFEGLADAEQADLMAELSTSVLKLDSVIKDLNYILQVKQEYSEYRENVDFANLLDDIKTSITNLVKNESVTIKSDFSNASGIMTLKSYIYSVFYNLISNSIKYRQPGIAPVIEITSSKDSNHLILVFRDNGLGIDLSKKGDQVFGLYKRFHYHTEGKGIGLYMVKTQVETLGGRIRINSEVNRGTEFIIEFEIN